MSSLRRKVMANQPHWLLYLRNLNIDKSIYTTDIYPNTSANINRDYVFECMFKVYKEYTTQPRTNIIQLSSVFRAVDWDSSKWFRVYMESTESGYTASSEASVINKVYRFERRNGKVYFYIDGVLNKSVTRTASYTPENDPIKFDATRNNVTFLFLRFKYLN